VETQDEVLSVRMAIANPRHITQIYRIPCHLTIQVTTYNLTRACPRLETRPPHRKSYYGDFSRPI